jgi:CHASE1-domain containing sensor protein
VRLMAGAFAALAVLVWWHPMPVFAQCVALIGLAGACLAYRSKLKQAQVVTERLAELKEIIRPLRDREGGQQ